MLETDHHDHHDHHHGHHHGGPLQLADRHAHESEIYDAMAKTMLAEMSDDELKVRSDRIPFANKEHVDFLSFAVEQLGPLEGKKVLEVGAGGGTLAVWLALQGADVTGIDVSEGILKVAAKRASVSGAKDNTNFLHCPIEELDHPDSHYDLIIGNNVVHHFERDLAMANLARMLRPDGRAVFCEPVLFLPDIARKARYSQIVSRWFPPHTHTPDERSLNRRDIEIIERYFAAVTWKPFQMLCRLQNFYELSDAMWNRLESIDRAVLGRIPPAKWLTRMIVLTLEDPRPPAGSSKSKLQGQEETNK